MRTIQVITLALGVLVAMPATATLPNSLKLGPGFNGPVEATSQALKLTTTPAKFGVGFKNGNKHCWSKGNWISPKPAVTVEFTAKTRAQLRIAIRKSWPGHSNTLIVLTPNNKYRCINVFSGRNFHIWADTFEVGKYEFFLQTRQSEYTYQRRGFKRIEIKPGRLFIRAIEFAPATVKLEPGFMPNPKTFEGFRVDKSDKTAQDFGATCPGRRNAPATTAQPSVLMQLTSPMKHLRFRNPGPFGYLLVTDTNGKTHCVGNKRVDLKNLAAGTLQIRGAAPPLPRDYAKQGITFSKLKFSIEDVSRKAKTWWRKDTPAVSLDSTLTKPQILPLKPEADLTTKKRCRENKYKYSTQPSLILDVKRPIKGRRYWLSSATSTQMYLDGPYAEDHRPDDSEYKRHCLRGSNLEANKLPALEMGRYFIYVGYTNPAQAEEARLIFADKDTAIERFAKVGEVTTKRAFHERDILDVYPFMFRYRADIDELSHDERQMLWKSAPKILRVYPKFDLDENAAWLPGKDFLKRNGVTPTFPKKDEALLWFRRGYVLAADGAYFKVNKSKYLTDAKPSATVVPKTVRNFYVPKLGVAIRMAGPADAKTVKKYEKARDKHDACRQKVWDKLYPSGSGRLKKVTYRGGRIVKVQDWGDAVRKKADRKCGTPKFRKRQDKLLKKLRKSIHKRIQTTLTELAAGAG